MLSLFLSFLFYWPPSNILMTTLNLLQQNVGKRKCFLARQFQPHISRSNFCVTILNPVMAL